MILTKETAAKWAELFAAAAAGRELQCLIHDEWKDAIDCFNPDWDINYPELWRIRPKKIKRPFNAEEMEALVGCVIRRFDAVGTPDGVCCAVSRYHPGKGEVWSMGLGTCTAAELLHEQFLYRLPGTTEWKPCWNETGLQ